jgi:hypothetical protein
MRKLSRQFRAPSLKFCAVISLFPFFLASPARPDTIILHDGASYAGQFGGAPAARLRSPTLRAFNTISRSATCNRSYSPRQTTSSRCAAARSTAATTPASAPSPSPIPKASAINSQ